MTILTVQSVKKGHAIVVAVTFTSWCTLRRVSLILVLPSMRLTIDKVVICESESSRLEVTLLTI